MGAMRFWPQFQRLGRLVVAACTLWGSVPASAAAPKRSTYGQQVVAAVLMGEAWGEGEAGMVAVAEVIRTRSDSTGLSPLGVVQQRYQFSCLNGVDPQKLIRRFRGHEDFALALRISRRLYNNPERLPGISRGATHFERSGTRAHWTQGRRPVVSVGSLDFYRLPKDF